MSRSPGGTGAGVAQDRQARPAQVAGEGQPALAAGAVDAQADHRRAEQVAGVDERRLDAAADLERRAVGDGLQPQERAVDVAAVVERLDFRLAPVALAVEVGGVLLLDLGRVAEHDGREGAGGRRAVDRAGEALARRGWAGCRSGRCGRG